MSGGSTDTSASASRTLDDTEHSFVVLTAFDRQRTLADSREAHVERQQLRDAIMPAESLDASSSEDQRIVVCSVIELGESRVEVASAHTHTREYRAS